MPVITNKAKISLAPAVWLLEDDYDYNADPYTISATTLLKPIRPIILNAQAMLTAGDSEHEIDLVDMIAARMGQALHDSLEHAWKKPKHLEKALELLKIPKSVRKNIIINPTKSDFEQRTDVIAIYIENRSSRKLGKWTVTGKYDLVMDGQVEDYKSTSVWGYIFDSNTEDYAMQGSIYRWLNQDKITKEKISIHYIFTDWSKVKAKQDPKYPQTRLLTKEIPLKNVHWVEDWMRQKLNKIEALIDADQSDLPLCTPEELWQKEAKWKYYKNPANITRATKNFDNERDAQALYMDHGSVGKIVHIPGEVVRCKYCSSIEKCEQAAGYIKSGLIKFD